MWRYLVLLVVTVFLGVFLGGLANDGTLGSHGGFVAMMIGSVLLGCLAGLLAPPRKPRANPGQGSAGERPSWKR